MKTTHHSNFERNNRWDLSERFTDKKNICICQDVLKHHLASWQMKWCFVLELCSCLSIYFVQVLLDLKGNNAGVFAQVWTKPLSGSLRGRSKGPLRALNYQVKDFTETRVLYCSRVSHGTLVTFVHLIIVRFFKGPAETIGHLGSFMWRYQIWLHSFVLCPYRSHQTLPVEPLCAG